MYSVPVLLACLFDFGVWIFISTIECFSTISQKQFQCMPSGPILFTSLVVSPETLQNPCGLLCFHIERFCCRHS